jgi:LPPG:FO 2-phospho-L-lactate transferase
MKVVALAGGVGGAKLADGLSRVLPYNDLTIVVNTGDDFVHLGLLICPDLDTVCYTLARIVNRETGWGRAEESWRAFESVGKLDGPTWFKLGDKDMGTHLVRTHRLGLGHSLTKIAKDFCRVWGVRTVILPMSDDRVSTMVKTTEGVMPFQEYFVARGCEPVVTGFIFDGVESARPARGVLESIEAAELVIICPSNPWVSIDPILSVPGIRSALNTLPVIAVSPLIGGSAVKGPAAKMYTELGYIPSAKVVAEHYGDLLEGYVFDEIDSNQLHDIESMDIKPFIYLVKRY